MFASHLNGGNELFLAQSLVLISSPATSVLVIGVFFMGGDEVYSSSLGEMGGLLLCLGVLEGGRITFCTGDAAVALAREGYACSACSDGTLAGGRLFCCCRRRRGRH